MANRSRLTTFLLILRFVPIITQLVDDVVTEFKSKDPTPKVDPLHASKMRAAVFRDDTLVNPKIDDSGLGPSASFGHDSLTAVRQLRNQVDKTPELAFDASLQRLLDDAEKQIRLNCDVLDP
jgi:hypothetical protein